MEIKSISVPASPRSKRYPSGSTIVRGSGGGTTVVGGGGSSVDVLKTTSGMPLSDANVLSSLRTLIEIRKHFVAKDDAGRELADTNSFSSLRTVAEIDKAIEELKKFLESNYLSKVKDDRAAGTIAFEKDITVGGQVTTLNMLVDALAYVYDLQVDHVATLFQTIIKDFVSSETYVPGMMGEGMKLYKALSGDWNLELDNVTVRKAITTFEMVIAKIRAVNGGLVVSAANGSVKSVSETTGDPAYYVLGIEGDMTFAADDLVRCQVFTAGRVKHYWLPIEQINGDSILLLKSGFPDGVTPAVGDELVQMGNRTDTSRQGVLYLTASEDGRPRFSVLDGINSPSLDGKNNTVLGCLDGITDTDLPADFQPSGYGLYSMNVFLKGIFILRNGKSIEQELTELSTQIEAIPGQISMKVTEEVGKIQIEGRNYLKNSGNWKEPGFNGGWENNGGGYNIDYSVTFNGKPTLRTVVGVGIRHDWIKLENNVEYTYSAMIKSDQDIIGNWSIPLHYHAGKDCENQGQIFVEKFDTSLVANEWKLLTLTFKLTGDANSFRPFIYIGPGNATFWIAYTKLEKGSIATGWTPAPEDIETRMSQAELSLKPENIWMGIKSNLQTFGRNYFKKSTSIIPLYGTPTIDRNHPDCPNGVYLVGDSSETSAVRFVNVINSNGYWTISFDLRGSQGVDFAGFTIDICDGDSYRATVTPDNDWRHHEFTVNVQNYTSNVYNFVDFEMITWAYIYVRNLKIEKGSIATDWTPAPEDADDRLTHTGIDIVNRKIMLSADKTVFRNNSGGQIAVFENDRIKADLIDAHQIVVNGLNAGNVTTGRLNVTGGGKIGAFSVLAGGSLESYKDTDVIRLNGQYEGSTHIYPGDMYMTDRDYNQLRMKAGHVSFTGVDFYVKATNGMTVDSQMSLRGAVCVNVRKVYGSSPVLDSDYFIACYNTSSITLTLPNSPQTGRVIVAKRMNNAHIEVQGGANRIYANSALTSVGIVRTGQTQRFTFDGQYWLREFIENG